MTLDKRYQPMCHNAMTERNLGWPRVFLSRMYCAPSVFLFFFSLSIISLLLVLFSCVVPEHSDSV